MAYVTPVIAGAVLLSFGFMAAFMKIEISSTLMIVMVLGAVLVSLPDIRKFQLTKEGFVLERAEARGRVAHSTAPATGRLRTQAEVPSAGTATTPPAHAEAERLRRGLLTIGFLYATVSGVLSVLLDSLTNGAVSLFTAPLMPVFCYSAALIALLLKFRAINKVQLFVAIPLIVYGAWLAAYRVGVWLVAPIGVPGFPQTVGGLAGGFVGAVLVGLGLCIFIKTLRSPMAILAIGVVGAITGTLVGITNVGVGSLRITVGSYPLFICWQAAVTLTVVFFMTRGRNLELLLKASPARP
jgi:hypothetical protein